MGWQTHVLEEQQEKEPQYDTRGGQWIPRSAISEHLRCTTEKYGGCGGRIHVGERFFFGVDGERLMHVRCFEVHAAQKPPCPNDD
jgi:hypothetical protein